MQKEREKRSVLAIFARAPVAGAVKTRLAQTAGDESAAKLYRAMLHDVLASGKTALKRVSGESQLKLFFTPVDAFERQDDSLQPFWNGERQAQSEGDLGTKLFECFHALRAKGFGRIAVIGSDAPDLPVPILVRAFETLNDHDLVFGPAPDGGFYLMGASCKVSPHWFRDVRWSRSSTLNDVLAKLQDQTIALLPPWSDVDDEDDLRALHERLESGQSRAPQTHRVLNEWQKDK
jgi:rSAM/selenodomain-associated transferase 1